MQELASKGRIVEDVVGALRNEEAAKLAAQRDAQTARSQVAQLEVGSATYNDIYTCSSCQSWAPTRCVSLVLDCQ